MQQSYLLELRQEPHRHRGKISPKRVMGRTSSKHSTYNPGRSVDRCEKQPFYPGGLDGCCDCSDQRHNFPQTAKRTVNCGRRCCAASIFQENELQPPLPYNRGRRWILQTWQVFKVHFKGDTTGVGSILRYQIRQSAKELPHVESIGVAKKVAQSVFDYYTANTKPNDRIGDFTDRIGFEEFTKGVL